MGTIATLGSMASQLYNNNQLSQAGANRSALTANAATAATSSNPASTSTSSSSAASSNITSSDFLTLLVTEMKNQDPTQPTDPNAYIQQLVGVNSLQQLISINQEIGGVTSGATQTGAARTVSSVAV